MARARNIKPSFFVNEELVELPFEARLLFIGLWTLADREGRLEDRPKRIKMAIFPADDVDVDAALNMLQHSGFIARYKARGVSVVQVLNFAKHQNPHVKEASSELPEIGEPDASPVQAPCKPGASTVRATLIPDSLIPESPPTPRKRGDDVPAGFVEFWSAYPRKVSKPQALKAWRKLSPDTQALAAILAGIERDRRSDQWLRDGGQFIPHPATWLNGRRWEDDDLKPDASPAVSDEMASLFAGCE